MVKVCSDLLSHLSLQGIFNIVLHTFTVPRRAAFWILWITMGMRSSLISFFKFFMYV